MASPKNKRTGQTWANLTRKQTFGKLESGHWPQKSSPVVSPQVLLISPFTTRFFEEKMGLRGPILELIAMPQPT